MTTAVLNNSTREIERKIGELSDRRRQLADEFARVIVGQRAVLDELLVTLFAGGHNLLEGVPGLAKTLMINTLARLLSLHFKRIQFTPYLMPSDNVGSNDVQDDHTPRMREME